MPTPSTVRYRSVRVAAPNGAPAVGSPAPIVMSPQAAQGSLTRHLRIFLFPPPAGAATAAAGNFTVKVYVLDPSTGIYSLVQTTTGVLYLDSILVRDVDCSDAYVEVANVQNPGNVDVYWAEM